MEKKMIDGKTEGENKRGGGGSGNVLARN